MGAPVGGAHNSSRHEAVLVVLLPRSNAAAPPPDGPPRPSTPLVTSAMPWPMAPTQSTPSKTLIC